MDKYRYFFHISDVKAITWIYSFRPLIISFTFCVSPFSQESHLVIDLGEESNTPSILELVSDPPDRQHVADTSPWL